MHTRQWRGTLREGVRGPGGGAGVLGLGQALQHRPGGPSPGRCSIAVAAVGGQLADIGSIVLHHLTTTAAAAAVSRRGRRRGGRGVGRGGGARGSCGGGGPGRGEFVCGPELVGAGLQQLQGELAQVRGLVQGQQRRLGQDLGGQLRQVQQLHTGRRGLEARQTAVQEGVLHGLAEGRTQHLLPDAVLESGGDAAQEDGGVGADGGLRVALQAHDAAHQLVLQLRLLQLVHDVHQTHQRRLS
mmetsp:Transcript_3639/g.4985  ORF Transcript_3639/g.4985 Transcript_3639/m.4985 type:complete len:242 (-) Transcript_3639:1370-2095(-)